MNASRCAIHDSRPRWKAAGFTLVEILVVLLILSISIALAGALTQPGSAHLLRVEAERLARLLELAATESRVSGIPVGWIADRAGYRFVRRLDNAMWSEWRDSDPLRPRILPDNVTIAAVRIESTRPQSVMRLEFVPHAPPPAYTIELASGEETYAVSGSPLGNVRAASLRVHQPGN